MAHTHAHSCRLTALSPSQIFEELPIRFHNPHLIQGLMLDMTDGQSASTGGPSLALSLRSSAARGVGAGGAAGHAGEALLLLLLLLFFSAYQHGIGI